jgi:biopolymer transport protein TolQ
MNEPAASLSILTLFENADIVVKGDLLLLLAASVWSWAVIIEKFFRLGVVRRSIDAHESATIAARSAEELSRSAAGTEDIAGQVVGAGLKESAVGFSANFESIAERRDRIERAMRLALNGEMRRLETSLPFLATVGSAAPFVGLFGTVWGIMRSFAGIAAAQNTSLGVVAPGIAEALFATAMGLAAAIPAVVAYNKFTVDLGRLAGRMQAVIARSGGVLARNVET